MLNNRPPSTSKPLYYKALCFYPTTQNQDDPALYNGIGRYLGLFNTYREAVDACRLFCDKHPNYVGYTVYDIWTQEEANHA